MAKVYSEDVLKIKKDLGKVKKEKPSKKEAPEMDAPKEEPKARAKASKKKKGKK